MSYLDFEVSDLLNITATNADINATASPSVPNTSYDAAFYFAGNFLSGNFIQDGSDIDTIKSNLVLDQDKFNASHAFLLDSASVSIIPAGRSTYGTAAAAQKALRVTATTYNDMTVDSSDTNIDTYVHINGDTAIPMINQQGALPSTSGPLAASDTGIGEALLNAVSQSLFKKMGKNAALNNDTELKTDLQNQLFTVINAAVGEANASYADSKYFKRYLDSGRYLSDSNLNVDEAKPYTVTNTVIHALVKITGNVEDSDDSPDLTNQDVSRRIFGNEAATPAETQVTNGAYTTHILVSLRQDERL